MKKYLHCIVIFLFISIASQANTPIPAMQGLVERILPKHSDRFTFRLDTKSKSAYYKISGSGNQVVIQGNSPVSLAAGLHRYMKEFLNVSVTWTDFHPVLPEKLPIPKVPIEEKSPYQVVTYMNYCTFGYSTVYWDWNRWEQEIDWMALHGVTHPLAMVGVEQVWMNFLEKCGYSESEIKRFLPGPVYMPWLLMGNMETLGGPMPGEWLVRQVELQKKILERMRSYGMSPIFQAFYGMVPSDFKTKFPKMKIVEQGKWNTFDRPDVLSPLDPEFNRLAQLWYDEYTALYGKSDYYAGDLFHEGGKTGGLDVAACAQAVQSAMLRFNPKAVWVVQSWGVNPTPELLKGLSPTHSLVVELCAEYWHRWRDKKGYAGIPWVWSNISNWGGNIGLHGRLDALATEPVKAQTDSFAAKTLVGIGFTPEGIETNPIVPDLWGDMVWRSKSPDLAAWLNRYAQYRYHSDLPSLQKAWQGFYKTAYGTYPGSRRPSEPVFCANPSLNVKTVSAWSQMKIFYNPDEFSTAVGIFLQDAEQLKNNKNYQYDAVDMVRQYLSDLGRSTYTSIQEAWRKRDKVAFDKATARFLQLMADQDELLLTHPQFCLLTWLSQARDAGSVEGIKDQYEYYNRLILTSWDEQEGDLNDYTHRELGGFLGTYYYKRWELYFNYLNQSWYNPDLPKPYTFGITRTWLYENIRDRIQLQKKNPVETSVKLFKKYYQIPQ